jgi:hypothetical protein
MLLKGINYEHLAKVQEAREEMEYVSTQPSHRVLAIRDTVYPNSVDDVRSIKDYSRWWHYIICRLYRNSNED